MEKRLTQYSCRHFDSTTGQHRCAIDGEFCREKCESFEYEPGTDETEAERLPACQPEWSEGDA